MKGVQKQKKKKKNFFFLSVLAQSLVGPTVKHISTNRRLLLFASLGKVVFSRR
jgi:hypothetical protein